jgi:hypothetical protein
MTVSYLQKIEFEELVIILQYSMDGKGNWKNDILNTVEPGYNDIGLYGTSSIVSYILWYRLIPHC